MMIEQISRHVFGGRKQTPEERMTQTEQAFEAVKAIVRRAIVTLMTLRDPDRKYQYRDSSWLFPVVNKAQESYGYVQYGFDPTPEDISQMEVVATWLAWLRRTEGEQALRRLISWTLGVPTWRIGSRERCSERTIRNRIDRSIAAIIKKFAAVDIAVELVEEIYDGKKLTTRNGRARSPFGLMFDRPDGLSGEVVLRKIYVHDIGFMIGNRRWRDGRHLAARFAD